MTDLPASDVQFEGLGATAGSAAEAARVLALRLNHWLVDHRGARILQLSIQSASSGSNLELTAILAYLDQATIDEALLSVAAEAEPSVSLPVAQAEEIVADSPEL
jgi:hypothetical protein